MEGVPKNNGFVEDEEDDEVDIDDEFEDIEEVDFDENNNFVSEWNSLPLYLPGLNEFFLFQTWVTVVYIENFPLDV